MRFEFWGLTFNIMSVRSLNKVQLIGNLTRDPELRYTPAGTAVCSFGLATNRGWTTDAGEKKEEAEFHRILSWNKLAELCSQLLKKGRKVYVEGRLQTRSWQGADGVQRTTTEVVISDMIILDSRRSFESREEGASQVPSVESPQAGAVAAVSSAPVVVPAANASPVQPSDSQVQDVKQETAANKDTKKNKNSKETDVTDQAEQKTEEINPDDIPF